MAPINCSQSCHLITVGNSVNDVNGDFLREGDGAEASPGNDEEAEGAEADTGNGKGGGLIWEISVAYQYQC